MTYSSLDRYVVEQYHVTGGAVVVVVVVVVVVGAAVVVVVVIGAAVVVVVVVVVVVMIVIVVVVGDVTLALRTNANRFIIRPSLQPTRMCWMLYRLRQRLNTEREVRYLEFH